MVTASPLSRFLAEREMTQVKFAVLSGVPQCQISAYLRRKRKPGRENALAIERATLGAVPVTSWDEPPARRPTKPAPRTSR
jgi:DNA-binding transcriptional regulator YdaS (Cro superfamily)